MMEMKTKKMFEKAQSITYNYSSKNSLLRIFKFYLKFTPYRLHK